MKADPRQTLHLASVYARLGDRPKALDYLERALKERQADLIFINVDPYFDSLRGEPRFQAVAKAVGLRPVVAG
jgi:hypothetical protein